MIVKENIFLMIVRQSGRKRIQDSGEIIHQHDLRQKNKYILEKCYPDWH